MNKKIQLNYYDTSGRLVFVRFLEEFKTPKRHFSKLPDLYLVKSKYLLTIAIFSNNLYEKTTKLKAKSNLEMQQLYLEEGFKQPF